MTPSAARRVAALALLATLLGCAKQAPTIPAASLGPPTWAVGDRWLFRRVPRAAGTPVAVTHEVIEATADGYAVRITRLNQELVRWWTPELGLVRHEVAGRALNSFEPPARYFAWPLAPGKSWSQDYVYRDGQRDGRYTNTWRIAKEAETVDVAAGWFVALRIERFGVDGQRLEAYWYAPDVRYWVRLEDDVNRYVEELLEFAPARR